MRQEGRKKVLPLTILALSFLFYLWLSAQIPYGIDDWSWGTADGIRHYMSADLNNRYVGNLIAICLARSALLKVLVMASVFTLIPACAAQLAVYCLRRFCAADADAALSAVLLLLGDLLMLSIPLAVWRQSYSWVAGFANFVCSGFVLLLYFTLLARAVPAPGEAETPSSFLRLAGFFVFGFLSQLILENVAVFIFLCTCLFLLCCRLFFKRRAPKRIRALALGNLLGTLLMFSGSMYRDLFSTGIAVNNYRALRFDPSSGPLAILLTLGRSFFSSFTRPTWGSNWILCCAVVLFLLVALLLDSRCPRHPLLPPLHILLLVYFVYVHFRGDIALPSWSPIHHLTSAAEPFFFLLVCYELVLLWHKKPGVLIPLLCAWLAIPALILPLVAIYVFGARVYATSDIVFMLFVLLLVAGLSASFPSLLRRLLALLCAALLLAVCVQRAIVYREIGRVQRERAALVLQMQEGQLQTAEFPLFPYPEYLWITDPDDPVRGALFDVFFKLPEGTSVQFPTAENYGELYDVDTW